MHIKIIGPTLVCFSLIQGCTSFQQVSHEETFRLISYYEDLPAPSTPPKQRVTEWVQAGNKTDKCKMFMGGEDRWWAEDGSEIFWDGECKDGYAYGTGREFAKSNKYGLSISLSVYQGGETQPKFYTAELPNKILYGYGEFSEDGMIGQKVEVFDHYASFNIQSTKGVFSSKYGGHFESRELRSTEVRRTKVKLNGFSYVFLTNSDPTADLQFSAYTMLGKNYVGFVIKKYRNGAIEHISLAAGEPKLVSLPQSYLDYLGRIENEINAALGQADDKIKMASEIEAIYKGRVCKGKPHVNFVNDEIYGMACLDAGPLTPYKAKAEVAKKARDSDVNARFAENQRAAAIAHQNKQSRSQFLQDAISAFAGTAEQMNQSATALQQQQQVQLQNQNRPQWGQQNNAYGTPVYNSSQCTGSVVNGVCTGVIIPSGIPEKCYGTMLNGRCTGPQF